MRIGEAFLLGLNKLFPARPIAGRESLDAYSRAQYSWAEDDFSYFAPFVFLQGKTVLDAGCGRGGKTIYYAEKGPEKIIGIDRKPTWIEQAKRFASQQNLANVSFELGSLNELSFDDNTFDVIFMNDVLEHVVRPMVVDTLKELRRVIKPGGLICINFPPWTSYDAAHLYDHIHVLWCQLFFSDKTLLSAYERLDPDGTELATQVYTELNRLTIAEFENLIEDLAFDVRHFELDTIRGIKLFSKVRPINKYLTRRVVAVLSKT